MKETRNNAFDLIVVTAANEAQARGYRAQLKGLDGFVVFADPGGRRVGSLGATVNALRKLSAKARFGGDMRVLICHSGGDARRTPGYAAMGKAFVPMRDGRAMLHHIVGEAEKLPGKSGVTVCCGDVVAYLDASKVRFADSGVTGVAYPDGAQRARRHGVYIAGGRGRALSRVRDFLQKPEVDSGVHLIDTGIMHFDWAVAEKMLKLPVAGDIYDEFPKLLLEGFAPFSVSVVPKCDFFHIGSSRELLEKLGCGGKLVDSCAAKIKSLGGDNIVTNIPASHAPVSLAKGECLTCLPIGRNGWYELKYRIDDNFKTDGLWEFHGLSNRMKEVNHARLLNLRRREIRVSAPVRIDLSGGWSDTPPICYLEGGTVLTAAVTLEGRRPIEVSVRERTDRFVKVVSRDLGKRRLFKSAEELADKHDPHDWCALVKSALAVTGFKFGERGIDISISANLPKGSGMGTSSILGAATISALLGRTDMAEVGELTLRLEQEMRTGGGWEDQFAGMAGGFNLLVSKPGRPQKISVRRLAPDRKFLREFHARSLLYFTGQKRMARNVLSRVLSFYGENPHGFAKILIASVKRLAEKAAAAMEKGDIDTFAECVNGYWRDKKLLDAGSTNDRVDGIIREIEPYISAVTLTGAGGGGFMYILAKSATDAKRIRARLEKNPPSRYSRFYDFDISDEGMSCTY